MGSQPSSRHGEHQLGEEEHVPTPGMEEKEQLEMCTTRVLGFLFHLSKTSFSRCKSKKTRFLSVPSQLGGAVYSSARQAQHVALTWAGRRSRLSPARSLGTIWRRGDLGCPLASRDLARCFPFSLVSSLGEKDVEVQQMVTSGGTSGLSTLPAPSLCSRLRVSPALLGP